MKTLLCSMLALLVLVWLNLAQTPAVAQEASTPEPSLTPLEALLQPDGTLDLQTGFSGSLDPTGWTLVSEPGQSPRFVRVSNSGEFTNGSALNSPAAVPGDEFWDDRFGGQLGENSPNGQVCVVAVSGSDVYVGGDFSIAGGVPANNIAKWNSVSNTWSALGSGVNNLGAGCAVRGIAVSGNDIYVGGAFSSAGGVPGTYAIAKWDGTNWSALGGGTVGGSVDVVAVEGGVVYIGGLFNQVRKVVNPINPDDLLTVRNIAGWNGEWFALGSGVNVGVNSRIWDVEVSGGNVYAGGAFITAGDIPANRIAKWNGTSWSALGSGLNSSVDAIAVNGDDVFVTGPFTMAGGVSANYVAKWNDASSSWSALGSGLNNHYTTGIGSLAVSGSDVYVGGGFTMAGGVSANNIAKWNSLTSTWSALGSGVDGFAYAIVVGVDSVYVGGTFGHAGGKPSYKFGLWHTAPGGNKVYLPIILR